MKGKLKQGDFKIGNGKDFYDLPVGKVVNITEEKNHPIYGKQYKIENSEEWFEVNCFEYIESI